MTARHRQLDKLSGRTGGGAPAAAVGGDTRPVLRMMLAYVPARLVPAAVGATALPVLAWMLPPPEFASLALVTAALPFVALTADWVVAGYQRHAHLDDGTEAQAAVWVLALSGTVAAGLAVTGLVCWRIEPLAVGLLVVPYLLLRLQWSKLQMTGRAVTYSTMQAGYTITRAVLMIGGALTHHAVASLAGWLTTVVLLVSAGPRLRMSRRPRLPALAGLGRIGIPLVAAAVALNTAAIADRFVVAALNGKEAAGVYAFAYLVGEGLLSLPAGVAYLALYWYTTHTWDAGRHREAMAALANFLRLQVVFGIGVVLVLALTSAELLNLLAPPEYRGAARILGLSSAAQVPAGVIQYLLLIAVLRGRSARVVAPSVGVAVANVALTVPAVHLAGTIGATVVTVLTYTGYCLVLARCVFSSVPGSRVVACLLVALATAAGATVAGPLPARLILVGVTVAVTVYATTRAWAVSARPAPRHLAERDLT